MAPRHANASEELGLPQGAERRDALQKLTTADGHFTLAYADLFIIHGCARAMHPGGVVCARVKNKLAHLVALQRSVQPRRMPVRGGMRCAALGNEFQDPPHQPIHSLMRLENIRMYVRRFCYSQRKET